MNPIDDDGGDIRFYLNKNGCIRYRRSREKARNILSVIRGVGTTERTRSELRRNGICFDYPKPAGLIEYLVAIGCDKPGIVLDFFPGSCSTAEAVMEATKKDAIDRTYIMVQLPEHCDETSEAAKTGYKTISQLGLARIKSAISRNYPLHGVRLFKLAASCVHPWSPSEGNLGDVLTGIRDNLRDDRSQSDVLYELLLKYGLDLAVTIDERVINKTAVFVVGAGALVICLGDHISLDVVEGIADLKDELQPEVMRVVFRDSGFADDVVKTNAIQILRQRGIEDVKSL